MCVEQTITKQGDYFAALWISYVQVVAVARNRQYYVIRILLNGG